MVNNKMCTLHYLNNFINQGLLKKLRDAKLVQQNSTVLVPTLLKMNPLHTFPPNLLVLKWVLKPTLMLHTHIYPNVPNVFFS